MTKESRALTRRLCELLVLFVLIVLALYLDGIRAATFVAAGEGSALFIVAIHLHGWEKLILQIHQVISGKRKGRLSP